MSLADVERCELYRSIPVLSGGKCKRNDVHLISCYRNITSPWTPDQARGDGEPRHSGEGQNPSSYRTRIPVDAGSSPA